MKPSRKLLSLAACLLALALPAQADITRSCSASLDVYVLDKKPNAYMNLATIEGRGSCSNKLHANECREQARREIDRCRGDLWAGRHANGIPASCDSLVEGSSRAGAKLQYDGIFLIAQPKRLTARGARAVCCQLRPNADKLLVAFEGRINGDQKCAANRIGPDSFQEEYGFPKYEMNCSEWRAQGICG